MHRHGPVIAHCTDSEDFSEDNNVPNVLFSYLFFNNLYTSMILLYFKVGNFNSISLPL